MNLSFVYNNRGEEYGKKDGFRQGHTMLLKHRKHSQQKRYR